MKSSGALGLKQTEHVFTSWDGTELFYRAWRPSSASKTGVLVLHRGHEHSGRMTEVVEDLAMDGLSFFAWDQRGHGRSPGTRGHAASLQAIVRDLDAFAQHVSETYGIPIENLAVLAQSVGAVIASAWIRERAPPIRGQILAVPAFRVRLYVPFAIPLLRLRKALFGNGEVRSYVKATMLTHDPEQAQRYRSDALVFPQIAVNVLLDLFDAGKRVVADAHKVTIPTLVMIAGSDRVVRKSTQRNFFRRLSSARKELHEFPGFYHAIFHEKERHLPIQKSRDFLKELFPSRGERSATVRASTA